MSKSSVLIGFAAVLSLAACSSDSDSSSATTADASTATPGTPTAGEPTDTIAASPATDAVADPAATTGEDSSADVGDCSDVPVEADVEAITAVALLPVEFQEFSGCVYLGDENNAGIYFEKLTTPEDLATFENPDAQFAVALNDPELPGAYFESGRLYASESGVVFEVQASVSGTDADQPIAVQLMKLWLTRVA